MPNKPVRQNAKYKEQQYRKRMTAQARSAGSIEAPELDLAGDAARTPSAPADDASVIRYAPSGTATAMATRPVTARRPISTQPPSATRIQRGRIAAQMQQMNLTDEMAFIRSDIRRLLILAAASFAVLIILAFVIQ